MFGKKPSEIYFVDENLKKAFEELKSGTSEETRLYEWLKRAFEDMQQNAFCGIQISKRLIPTEYTKRYGIRNLWKYNLPDAWRLLYSVQGSEVKIISIVLEWMNHKNYDRKFGY